MEEAEAKIRQQLTTAGELFNSGKYSQCRKVLGEIKIAHLSLDLNLIIAQYKESPTRAPQLAKKLFQVLSTHPPPPKAPRIAYELYYWNAVVLAAKSGQPEAAELIAQEGIIFADSLRTESSLMLLYHLLSAREKSGRLASCLALVGILHDLARARQLNESELAYRFLCQILFTRVLLKLGIIEASKVIFMMRFNQSPEGQLDLPHIASIPTALYQQILHAEIEFHASSYLQALKILSQLLPAADSLGKNREMVRAMIDHNVAVVLTHLQRPTASQVLFKKTLKYLTTAQQIEQHSERSNWLSKCKENMLLAGLLNKTAPNSTLFELIKSCGGFNSFKLTYRKAEVCLRYYHELLTEPQRILVSKEVHDQYEPVYYHPNQPYFQQKGKNKNPTYTAGKAYYRRYVLPEWQETNLTGETLQEEKDKKKEKDKPVKNGKNIKKEEELPRQPQVNPKEAHLTKLCEILNGAEGFLKQALTLLEKERNVVVRMQGEEQSLAQQVNEKLHVEYVEYKSSILSQLAYVHLAQHHWTQALLAADAYLHFARLHQLPTRSSFHQQAFFAVDMHRIEALTQLNRTTCAYEAMQDAAGAVDYAETAQLLASSTANQQAAQCYIEEMSQYGNLCFNVAVLHSHDNKIPEAFQAIQKVLQQLRVVPSSPQARLPLSAIQLLTHYNLRTGNSPSALQLIKRRRILTLPGTLSHHPPTLSITK